MSHGYRTSPSIRGTEENSPETVRLIANLSPDLIAPSVSEARKASIYIFLLRLRWMWRRSDPRAQKGLLARDNESQPLADEIVSLLKSTPVPELKANFEIAGRKTTDFKHAAIRKLNVHKVDCVIFHNINFPRKYPENIRNVFSYIN